MESWPEQPVEMLQTESLIPDAKKQKKHGKKKTKNLASSIKRWGWTIPIFVDENSKILKGHGRFLAAKALKIEEVPCIVAAGWTNQQIKAYSEADDETTRDEEIASNTKRIEAIEEQLRKR